MILNRWKNFFSQLLNVHNVSDVRQIEIHIAEPLVLGPSCLEVEIAIAKLKKYKSPGSDQIPAELIQAGGEMLLCAVHKFITSIWNKEEEWKEYYCTRGGEMLLYAVHKLISSIWNKEEEWKEYYCTSSEKNVTKLTVIIIVGYHCYQLHTKCYSISSPQG
jgi:hypothetical protein